jgi:hypothetical protein
MEPGAVEVSAKLCFVKTFVSSIISTVNGRYQILESEILVHFRRKQTIESKKYEWQNIQNKSTKKVEEVLELCYPSNWLGITVHKSQD